MSEHTPGPWLVADTPHIGRKNIFAIGAQPHHVASLISGSRSKLDRFDADALAMAAAPDLLAALRTIVGFVNLDPKVLTRDQIAYREANVVAPARAAIAKAEGRKA